MSVEAFATVLSALTNQQRRQFERQLIVIALRCGVSQPRQFIKYTPLPVPVDCVSRLAVELELDHKFYFGRARACDVAALLGIHAGTLLSRLRNKGVYDRKFGRHTLTVIRGHPSDRVSPDEQAAARRQLEGLIGQPSKPISVYGTLMSCYVNRKDFSGAVSMSIEAFTTVLSSLTLSQRRQLQPQLFALARLCGASSPRRFVKSHRAEAPSLDAPHHFTGHPVKLWLDGNLSLGCIYADELAVLLGLSTGTLYQYLTNGGGQLDRQFCGRVLTVIRGHPSDTIKPAESDATRRQLERLLNGRPLGPGAWSAKAVATS